MKNHISMKESQKRFNDNIIKLSDANSYDECIKEWKCVGFKKEETMTNHCLCGQKLKNQYFYVNKITKKIIISGKSCRQKLPTNYIFNEDFVGDLSNLLNNNINITFNIGDFNLVDYCEKNKIEIYKTLIEKINERDNIDDLAKYKIYLIKEWKPLINITNLLNKINKKIDDIKLKQQREEEERKKREAERLKLIENQKVEIHYGASIIKEFFPKNTNYIRKKPRSGSQFIK